MDADLQEALNKISSLESFEASLAEDLVEHQHSHVGLPGFLWSFLLPGPGR